MYTKDQIRQKLRQVETHPASENKPQNGAGRASEHPGRIWPEPKPLPDGLLPVEQFSLEFLPDALGPWIGDISNRLQCPPDYVAVAAITGLGSVIGRRVGIKPQQRTDWVEIPNFWGMFIGRPGMLKSPAMSEALKPVHRLEAEAAKENEIAQQAYAAGINAFELRKQVAASLAKQALKKDKNAKLNLEIGDAPQEPQLVRYRTNDSSYEAIGELLIANPNGILIERDELVSLLRQLDRDDQAVARGFYLSGWSGTQPYTFDRIIRGHRHIEAVCISLVGNTQPARIVEYVRRANADGAGGDGLLQRFGLMVWPDGPADWRDVDQFPDSRWREKAWEVFQRASTLLDAEAIGMGAGRGSYDSIPAFRFDAAAHDDFLGWRTDLERRLRSGTLSPVMEGHLAKFRKLVPALALVNHLADAGQGPVGQNALLRALAFTAYLETHAHRVYGASNILEIASAKAILAKIKSGDLPATFTARDVHRPRWSGLTEIAHIHTGLDLLADLDHLASVTLPAGEQGGRPKTTYSVNPRSMG
jgi:putative DNA primase/helicase